MDLCIELILQKDDKCGAIVLGPFACGRLSTTLNKNGPPLMVCNTDPHEKPGQQWVVLCVEDCVCSEYFDSVGRPHDTSFR